MKNRTRILATAQAFRILVESAYYWRATGHTHARRRAYLHRLNTGGVISLDKQEELLEKAGFCVAQQKVWNLPKT